KTPQKNFIAGVRSRRREDLKTDILNGHLSASLCHMGNISLLCGEPIGFDKLPQHFANQPQAGKAIERMMKHLTANGINTAKRAVTLGPLLRMDSAKERFAGEQSDRANLFLKDSYREPFVVREYV